MPKKKDAWKIETISFKMFIRANILIMNKITRSFISTENQ